MYAYLQPDIALPADADAALLIGRVHVAGRGAVLVRVQRDNIYDLSHLAATCSDLLERSDAAAAVRACNDAPPLASTQAVLANSAFDRHNPDLPWFAAPCDLQAIKAAGVTFVDSMLERVIEEQAGGDASRAERS